MQNEEKTSIRITGEVRDLLKKLGKMDLRTQEKQLEVIVKEAAKARGIYKDKSLA